jgi:multiple sugar transport system substrate-binding protein
VNERLVSRPTRRRLPGAVGGAAAPALAAGCVAPEITVPGAPPTGGEVTGPATLEFLTREQPYDEIFEQAVQGFRAKFPQIEVARDHQSGNGPFNQKLETLVAAGTPPDVAFATGSTYHGQAARGFYQDLTPYAARDRSFDLNDFVPFWLEAGRYRNKQYLFPFDAGTMVLYWNRRHFGDAGVKPPDVRQPMTWPQFLETARLLTRTPPAVPATQARFGCELAANRLWYLLPWQMGVELFDRDFTRCRLDDPRAVDALQFAADLRGKHGVWRPASFQGPPTEFTSGTVATIQQGYWASGGYRRTMKPAGEDFDVMPLPTFPGRPRLTVGWGSGNAILAGSRHTAAAWELVKYLSDKEVAEYLLEEGLAQPVRKSHANSPAFRRNTPPYSFDVPLDDAKSARTPPFHPVMSELPGLMDAALAEAYAGSSAVKPLIDRFLPQINQKLQEYSRRFPVT